VYVIVATSLPRPMIKSSKGTGTSMTLILNPASSVANVEQSGG